MAEGLKGFVGSCTTPALLANIREVASRLVKQALDEVGCDHYVAREISAQVNVKARADDPTQLDITVPVEVHKWLATR